MARQLSLQLKLFAAHMRRHRTRMLLTLLAIVIGVASVTGILALNRSAYASFENAIASIAGPAQIEISNGSVGVPQELLAAIRATPGVHAGAGVIQQFVRLPGLENRRVCIFGIDLLGDSRVWSGLFDRDTFDVGDELALGSDPRGALLSASLAADGKFTLRDLIPITSPLGATSLRMHGSFSDQRFARVFQGDVAIMDVFRAQSVFGKGGRFDWIQVVATPGADLGAVSASLAHVVDGYGQVSSPATRGKRVEAILRSNRWMLTLSSLFAAAVGLFLVAQSMYTSTEQRRATFATLRCLGASREQLAGVVLIEAGALGIVGSAVGVLAGLAFCKVALGPFGVFLSTTYLQVKPADLVIATPDLVTSLAIGLGATMAGAIAPAVAVTATSPIGTLRRSWSTVTSPAGGSLILGTFLVVLGLLVPSLRLPREWFAVQTGQAFAAIVIVLVGASLLTPAVLGATGIAIRPWLVRIWGSVGHWLWRRLAVAGPRSTLTIASMAAGFSFAALMSAFIASYRTAVIDYLERSFPADVILNVGPPMSMLAGPVASVELIDEVRAMPGVATVAPMRFLEGAFAGNSIVVQGIGDDALLGRFPPGTIDATRGEVIVSDTLMERYGLVEGSHFALETPTGPIDLVVKIVEADYFLDLGSVKLPWSVFADRWKEDKANIFLVGLTPGADPAELKKAIDARFADRYDLTVLTRNDTRVAINALIDSTFALMFLCEGLAIAVALIAVMNGVASALLDRADQLRILRTVGLTPRALRRMAVAEGAIVGLVGGAIGLLAGCAIAYRLLTVSWRTIAGFHMPVVWPLAPLVVGLLTAIITGALAGYAASRGAATGSIALRLSRQTAAG